jgi:hypothetical protein
MAFGLSGRNVEPLFYVSTDPIAENDSAPIENEGWPN